MEVGQEVQVLPLELAEVACAAAGTKWNPPRQKRAGQRGTIAELSDEGAKAKVTFLDEIQDPETGAVVRTDTQTLLFPTTALQSVDAAGEAAQAQMEGALAAASAKVAEATADVSRLQAEKDAATVALQAQVDSLSKGKEQQTLKVTRLQKELASGLKAAEAATTAAAAAQEERRVALDRAQTAEGAVAGLERRVQLVVEAARGGQTAQHHAESSGEASVSAHDIFEIVLDVTDEHIYGSGGASVCYQFDVQSFDVSFGVWLKRTGADVLSHGEEVVLISEKFESGGGTVMSELQVTTPGSYTLRWDNTHSRMRAKQITYKCSIRTEPARAAAASVLGGFDDGIGGGKGSPSPRPMTPGAGAAAAVGGGGAVSAAVAAELTQCKAELVGCREELGKEREATGKLQAELKEALGKIAAAEAQSKASMERVAALESAQAAAIAATETLSKDFEVPDFDDIPDFDD